MSSACLLQGTPVSQISRVAEVETSGTAGNNTATVAVTGLTTQTGFVTAYVSVPPAGGGGVLQTTTLGADQVVFTCNNPTVAGQKTKIRYCVLSL